MGNLGLWDLITLVGIPERIEIELLLSSKKQGDKLSFFLAPKIKEIYPFGFLKNYNILFIDIKNSTKFLNLENKFLNQDQENIILHLVNFLKEAVFLLQEELSPNLIGLKLVGDGIIFLTRNSDLDENFLKIHWAKLKTYVNDLNVDFRIVGGIGELYCIEFKTARETLKECVGCPISYLVKKSKEVDTYKWFGEITREKCRELLNS